MFQESIRIQARVIEEITGEKRSTRLLLGHPVGIATHLFHKPRDVPCSGASRDSYYSSVVWSRYLYTGRRQVAQGAITTGRTDEQSDENRAHGSTKSPGCRQGPISLADDRRWHRVAATSQDLTDPRLEAIDRSASLAAIDAGRRSGARRIVASIERYSISKEVSRIKVAGGRRTGAERRSAAAIYVKNKEAFVKQSANNGGSRAARCSSCVKKQEVLPLEFEPYPRPGATEDRIGRSCRILCVYNYFTHHEDTSEHQAFLYINNYTHSLCLNSYNQ
ncbi:uncharacterized protein LOC112637266 [Camponotus floridanus]|uniref:uncharacterized protein LOC112637266 n=1 Tax=Camponotus floridanus TaxID=104421 RepID=UPI000DC6B34F|nr:uncharacterized protein LOC112637266 [Camponotus floridanus]